jgi:hypothetical protein
LNLLPCLIETSNSKYDLPFISNCFHDNDPSPPSGNLKQKAYTVTLLKLHNQSTEVNQIYHRFQH